MSNLLDVLYVIAYLVMAAVLAGVVVWMEFRGARELLSSGFGTNWGTGYMIMFILPCAVLCAPIAIFFLRQHLPVPAIAIPVAVYILPAIVALVLHEKQEH